MATLKGLVVPAGDGQHLEESSGQVTTMKLFGRETGQSVTLFEQAVHRYPDCHDRCDTSNALALPHRCLSWPAK